ncbi:MAG TPA: AraC family transcriptional regulator [Bacillota bacterium]
MEAWHQKNLTDETSPFQLIITDIPEFPPHWHEELEIIYVLDEDLVIGLNHEVYTLKPRDIFLIGPGEVHFFINPPKKSKRVIIQFELAIFESFAARMREQKFSNPLIRSIDERSHPHRGLERQILRIKEEYIRHREGHELAIKARLYDLVVILLRQVPMVPYSSVAQNKHLKRLERLEQVFRYVEEHYTQRISLTEVAAAANFSIYHFTRFFKEATGMTFIMYLNHYRIAKAVRYLTATTDPITEIAFKSGFESIQSFNRVFRQLKGCSPTSYIKGLLAK